MSYLGADASTRNLALAFVSPGSDKVRTALFKLPGADEAVFDVTLVRAAESVGSFCGLLKIKECFIEAPLLLVDGAHSAATAMALIQLTGAIRAAACRAGARVTLVAVSTARRHFIGTGNLKRDDAKQAVMQRCNELGWSIKNDDGRDDDNRGDACAVYSYGRSQRDPSWAPKATPLFAVAKGGAA